MNARIKLIATAGIALVISGGCATAEPVSKSTTPSPGRTTLEQLDWMAGSWAGQKSGAAIEEHWMSPKGGLMVGMHRDVLPEGGTEFEFLRIEETGEGLVYLAGPGGNEPTAFKAVEIGERRVVFENPQHDFPQRIIYSREGESLLARIEGKSEDKEVSVHWRFSPLEDEVK